MFTAHGEWVVSKNMPEYEKSFRELVKDGSHLSGSDAKRELVSGTKKVIACTCVSSNKTRNTANAFTSSWKTTGRGHQLQY